MEKLIDCSSLRCKGRPSKCYLNTAKGVFHCFRCHRSGKVEDWGVRRVENLSPFPERERPAPEFVYDEGQAGHYLEVRGVASEVLRQVQYYPSAKGIVFVFQDGEYWQERRWERYSPPRWLTASGKHSGYFLEFHPNKGRIFVVEGIIDALRVAEFENVVASLGSLPTERLLYHILLKGYEDVVWFPDGDVTNVLRSRGLRKLISVLSGTGGSFSIRVLNDLGPGEDPGGLTRARLIEILASVGEG